MSPFALGGPWYSSSLKPTWSADLRTGVILFQSLAVAGVANMSTPEPIRAVSAGLGAFGGRSLATKLRRRHLRHCGVPTLLPPLSCPPDVRPIWAPIIVASTKRCRSRSMTESADNSSTVVYDPFNGLAELQRRCYPRGQLGLERGVAAVLARIGVFGKA